MKAQEAAKLAQCRNDEECVDYLERRIEELRLVFQKHRPVYEGISSFQTLWGSLTEVEQKLKDPAILSNRGGILLKTEKEKKRLMRELQKAEAEAASAIAQYESTQGATFRLSNGKTFQEAADDQWAGLRSSGRSSSARVRAGSAAKRLVPNDIAQG